jgi:hypothetical protein
MVLGIPLSAWVTRQPMRSIVTISGLESLAFASTPAWLSFVLTGFLIAGVYFVYRQHKRIGEQLADRPVETLPVASASPPQASYEPTAWEGYDSEEAWVAAITEQNRLVNLGRSVDGLITPFKIKDATEAAERLFEWKQSLRLWSSKTDAQYRLRLADKVDEIRLKISASDIEKPIQAEADLWSLGVLSKKKIEVSDDLERIIDALESIFFNIRDER